MIVAYQSGASFRLALDSYQLADSPLRLTALAVLKEPSEVASFVKGDISAMSHMLSPFEAMRLGDSPWRKEGVK